ncbi:MAG: lipoprotein [Methylococcales bacterium]
MKKFLLVLIVGCAVSSCGQIGPLYHPDEQAPIYVPDGQYSDPKEDH